MDEKARTLVPSEAARQLSVTLDYIYRELWSGRFAGAVKSEGQWKIPVQAVKTRLKGKK